MDAGAKCDEWYPKPLWPGRWLAESGDGKSVEAVVIDGELRDGRRWRPLDPRPPEYFPQRYTGVREADDAVRLPEPDESGDIFFPNGDCVSPVQGRWAAIKESGQWIGGYKNTYESPESAALALAALGQGPAAETPSRNYATLRELLDGNDEFVPARLVRPLLAGRDSLAERLTAAGKVNRILSEGRDKDERARATASARAEKAEALVAELRAELGQLDAGRNEAAAIVSDREAVEITIADLLASSYSEGIRAGRYLAVFLAEGCRQ